MEEIEVRLDALQGQLRATGDVLLAVIQTLSPLAAAQAAASLAAEVLAPAEEDASDAETEARQAIGQAYLALLSARAKSRG